MPNYLLAGGGTAGHVNPLLALAAEIVEHEPESTTVALGTATGLEARLVPERGIPLETIARLPFPRKPGLYALRFPVAFAGAVWRTVKIMRKRRIDAVVGFGGYAAAPAYLAAKILRLPLVIHEANALPGIANRVGAKYTPWVGVTFPGTPVANATVTGMPLRREIVELDGAAVRGEAVAYFGLDPNKRTLLVTGGSLGARGINEGIMSAAARLAAADVQVLHIWGGLTEQQVASVPGYRVLEYCDRMDLAFSVADFVVSRAGATAVSEISGLGIPAAFAPYRHGNGEQVRNCAAVVAAGGAILVEDSEITPEWVSAVLLPVLSDPVRLATMSECARSVSRLDGTQRLYQLLQMALAGDAAR